MNGSNHLTVKEKEALNKLMAGLKKLYSGNLSRAILYGSKARGDAEPDSDIDIVVVLKQMGSSSDEIKKMNKIAAPICLANDLLISTIPIEEKWFTEPYKPIFVCNVLRDGIEL